MPVFPTTYREQQPEALAGMVHNMRASDSITRSCETEAGISFGVAVSRGTDTQRQCILGGSVTLFLGVAIRDVTLEASQVDKYGETQNVGILTNGEIWVLCSGSPTPASPVNFNGTTGVFAPSGGVGPIVGARFTSLPTTDPDGNAIVRLHLPNFNQAGA